jgi:integrase
MPKLAKRPDSPNYYAWVTDPLTGKKKRRSTKERNQRTAGVVAERAERSALSPYSPTNLEAAIHAFLTQRAVMKSAATQEFYRKKLGVVAHRLGPHRDLATVDAGVVDAYCAKRLAEGTSRSTIGKERTALRQVLKLARRQKKYPHALDEIFDAWEVGYEPRERWCPTEEAWAIIGVLPPHRGAVVAFIIATGARMGEAMRAQREDISSDRSQVALRGTKTKRSKRTAPVFPWGAPFLAYALEHGAGVSGRPLFQDWTKAMRWDLKRVCDKLKIPGVSANDLRRTYSQWLRQRGVEPALIGATLGHADSRMVEVVYGKLPPDKLRPLIDRQVKETEDK